MSEFHQATAPSSTTVVDVGQEAMIVQTVMSIAKKVRVIMALHLAEIGLTNGQDEVLLALDPVRPVSYQVLAERLDLRPDVLSRMLENLVAKGLVVEVGDSARSARWTLLRISPSGLAVQERIRDIWNEVGAGLVVPNSTVPLDWLIEELQQMKGQTSQKLTRFC